jgi:hypothetical protein
MEIKQKLKVAGIIVAVIVLVAGAAVLIVSYYSKLKNPNQK